MTIDLLKTAHELNSRIGDHITITTNEDNARVTLSVWFDAQVVTDTPDLVA